MLIATFTPRSVMAPMPRLSVPFSIAWFDRPDVLTNDLSGNKFSQPRAEPNLPLGAGGFCPAADHRVERPAALESVDTDEVHEKVEKAMLNGLMMDDFQLSLTVLVERAERLTSACPVVSRRADGSVRRTTLGECAQRARRLASGLADLGIGDGDRVATLLWNQTEHLELYFAVPLMGAVIHTLNPRLSPDDLSYIAADAEDRVARRRRVSAPSPRLDRTRTSST